MTKLAIRARTAALSLSLAAGVAGATMLSASPAQALTTFFNDWESVDFGSGAGFTILPAYEGWTAVAGGGIEVQFNGVAGAPLSGENLVELDSTSNTTMSRAIDAGFYTLTFFYSPRPTIPVTSNGIDVLLNGSSIFNVSGAGGGSTSWVQQTVNFSLVAPGTLSFAAVGTSDSLGGYVEDVRLAAAIPEPATWAMMILGFGGMGALVRRRRAALAT